MQSSFEYLGVPEDSKFPLLGVWVSSSHLTQSGIATINPRNLKNDQWIRFIGFEMVPNMFEVIFYRQIFYILLKGKILRYVPLNYSSYIPLFTL